MSNSVVLASIAAMFAGVPHSANAIDSPQTNGAQPGQGSRIAAEALAAKFSDPAPSTDAHAWPRPDASAVAAVAPPPEPESLTLLAALSESARSIGEHAAASDTFARQAAESIEPRIKRADTAQKPKNAKRKRLANKRRGEDAYRQALAGPNLQQSQKNEPSLLAKIFTPSSWTWPSPIDDSETAAQTTRNALRSSE
ncbi:MAG: hypothetical protein ACKVP4_11605 [Hyphomicrobium sp.]